MLIKSMELSVKSLKLFQQMETFEGENKGYLAHVAVVTYCRNRQEDDKSKFRILLVSFFSSFFSFE